MTIPTENADLLIGDDNTNVILGLGGNDAIFGAGEADLLGGDGGSDLLVGGRGDDTLNGGNGSDTASYNDDVFEIFANLRTGTVTLTANGILETDTLLNIENITGGGGADNVNGNDKANIISGMDGNDRVFSNGGNDKIYGGNGHDFMMGGMGADVLDGGAGEDIIWYTGSSSGVTINLVTGVGSGGEAQGDSIISIEDVVGSTHDDLITGNGSDNDLLGAAGSDTLVGGDGDDILNGGAGADHMDGGSGADLLNYMESVAGVTIDLLSGAASGGEAQGDTFVSMESVLGSTFDDTLYGNAGDNYFRGSDGQDTIFGRSGNDVLNGGDGKDIVTGGGGNDLLEGDGGRDFLTGGAGSDKFQFIKLSDSATTASTRDLIKDFATGTDIVSINSIDANFLVNGDQAFDFIEMSAFSGTAGQLHAVFAGANTILEGDVDGNKTADFQIEFTGHVTFSDIDFWL